MIGGIDVTIPCDDGTVSLDIAVRAIRHVWVNAQFENALNAERYVDYSQIPFGMVRQLFAYRDHSCRLDDMLYLIRSEAGLTIVTHVPVTDDASRIIFAIRACLDGRPL